METFYKIARPDGWDFYTGKTINYRDNIGKTVRRAKQGRVKLCSETTIHALRDPNQCFIGGQLPCSLYLVSGKPYAEDEDKCGFKQLKIIKELQPEKVFKWRYKEACNPVNPLNIKPPQKITEKHVRLLKQWASVWDSVRALIWDSVWDSVGAYMGWIFAPAVKQWKHVNHKPGEYPFQAAVDLWMMGLVPSYDGKAWRLHGGKNAKILWEGKL